MLKAPGFGREICTSLALLSAPFIHFGFSIMRAILANACLQFRSRDRRKVFAANHVSVSHFKQQYFVYWCRVSVSRVNVLISKNRSAPDVNISNFSCSAHSHSACFLFHETRVLTRYSERIDRRFFGRHVDMSNLNKQYISKLAIRQWYIYIYSALWLFFVNTFEMHCFLF